MKKAIVRILATLGAIYLIAIVATVVVLQSRKPHVPRKTILEVNLETPLTEYVPNGAVTMIGLSDWWRDLEPSPRAWPRCRRFAMR